MGSGAGQARLGMPLVRVQALSRDLHPTDLVRPDHAKARVRALRQTHDDLGEAGRVISCHDFVDNQVRLQLFSLAYNLANFLRRLALPPDVNGADGCRQPGVISEHRFLRETWTCGYSCTQSASW
jgi:hypothetical protein